MVESSRIKRTVKDKTTGAKAAAQTTKGKTKAATGKALGNRKMQAKGKLEEIEGKTKQAVRRVKKSVND